MFISYDKDLDLLTVNISNDPAMYWGTRELDGGLTVDLSRDRVPLRFEVTEASSKYPAEDLDQVNSAHTWLSLREAGDFIGLSPDTLRVQVNSGRLRAQKRGNVWFTTLNWLGDYLSSRRYNAKPTRDLDGM